jgi:predicted RNA-binding protein with TRAM domain
MNRDFGNGGNRDRFNDRGNSGSFGNAPPVNVGEELDVRIEAVGEKGDGVAKRNGFVIFIPGVKEGQNVRIKVTRVLRKVGFAEVIGAASAVPASNESPKAPAEQEETYSPEKDSDDFGEDSTDLEASEDLSDDEEEK